MSEFKIEIGDLIDGKLMCGGDFSGVVTRIIENKLYENNRFIDVYEVQLIDKPAYFANTFANIPFENVKSIVNRKQHERKYNAR